MELKYDDRMAELTSKHLLVGLDANEITELQSILDACPQTRQIFDEIMSDVPGLLKGALTMSTIDIDTAFRDFWNKVRGCPFCSLLVIVISIAAKALMFG